MTETDPLPSAGRPRVSRTRLILGAIGVVVIASIAVAVYASFHAGNAYASFKRTCLATSGNTVVVVSQSLQSAYMGGAQKSYKMGCRAPDGTVISTAKTSKP
jgi:hypothetical protein